MTEIEDVLSSKGRIRILKLLAETELTAYSIGKRVGLGRSNTIYHLKILEKSGIIVPKFVGETRLFVYNVANPRAMAVKRFILAWE